MSETLYLKVAILLPLLAPVAAWLAQALGLRDDTGISAILIGSVIVGGVPYFLSAIAALVWLRGRTAEDHRRLAVIAPLAFIPVLALGIGVSGSLGRPSWEPFNLVSLLAWSAFFSCSLGYLYVALVMMFRPWFVRRLPT